MNLAPYRELLARPQVLSLFVVGALCRIPNSAATVVITVFVVTGLDGSYTQAGLVAAAMTVGAAIGAPWRGWLLDRVGLRRALLPSVVVEGAVWFSFPFLPYFGVVAAALVGGLLAIPVYAVIRQGMSVLAEPGQQRTAFSLDSISTELSYLVGPAAGAALTAAWSPTGTVFLVAAVTVASGVGLMVFNPPMHRVAEGLEPLDPAPTGSPTTTPTPAVAPETTLPPTPAPTTLTPLPAPPAPPTPPSARRHDPAPPTPPIPPATRWHDLASPRLLATLAATVVALAVIGAIDVPVVALTRESGQAGLTWVVFTTWSLASLAGVLVFGGSTREVPVFGLLLGLCLLAAPVGLAPGAWWLALLIIPTGLLCAPVLAATGAEVGRAVPEYRRGEAMGWYSSATTIGLGAGTPLAGWAIDRAGPWAGFALIGTIGAAVAAIGLGLVVWATDRPSSVAGPALTGEFATEHGAPSGVSPTRRQSLGTPEA